MLRWYRSARRDLPWRRTRDPYAIWVSEIMLQQTRVVAAVPYYERFLKRFPDVGSLSRAREETVLALWSGLGYYRRARMLHAASRVVAKKGMPQDYRGLLELPGIGEYTAAAIASIAYDERVAVVDGNVERVVARFLGAYPTKRETKEQMTRWIPARSPGDFNQSVMELGATVCTPRNPDCASCPLRADCRGKHDPHSYPAPKKRPEIRIVQKCVKFATSKGRVFLRQNEDQRVLQGMWELPPSRGSDESLGAVRHSILDRSYRLTIHAGRATGAGAWFTPAQLKKLPLATSARKCLRVVGFLS